MSDDVLTEAFSRLDLMRHDKGQTWDLSPNDQRDITLVLGEAKRLRARVEALEKERDGYIEFKDLAVKQRDAAEARVEALEKERDEAITNLAQHERNYRCEACDHTIEFRDRANAAEAENARLRRIVEEAPCNCVTRLGHVPHCFKTLAQEGK